MASKDLTIPISETFVSVQGEGKLTGVPSAFVRTSGCNLRCAWCDTPYASWAPEGGKQTVDELIAFVRTSGVRHAVLTGGEPMLFAGLVPLTHGLRDAGIHVTIETAGTIENPPGAQERVHADLMSLSPKLANSTPWQGFAGATGASITIDGRSTEAVAQKHERDRLKPDIVRTLMASSADRQLKFVVMSPEDVPEIEALIDELDAVPSDVVMMPEGVRTPEPASIAWLVDLCIARGWRYGHRLHVELFGDTHGT